MEHRWAHVTLSGRSMVKSHVTLSGWPVVKCHVTLSGRPVVECDLYLYVVFEDNRHILSW